MSDDRQAKAARLRRDTTMTYAEIAAECGYADRRCAFEAVKRYRGPLPELEEPPTEPVPKPTVVPLFPGSNVCRRCHGRTLVTNYGVTFCLHCGGEAEALEPLPWIRNGRGEHHG